MKNITKKLIVLVTAFSLMAGVFTVMAQADAKSTYWLEGVSKAADGHMRMYYMGSTILLDGKVRKAASRNKVYDAAEKKCSYKLKVAGNCKVIYVEGQDKQTMTYKKWAKNNGYAQTKGAEVSFLEAVLKVEGKKITKIYFSA